MFSPTRYMSSYCFHPSPPLPPYPCFCKADEMDGRIFDPESPQLKPPMPNLNALAASGAVFTRAYNQAPQCVPSRSAMMVMYALRSLTCVHTCSKTY